MNSIIIFDNWQKKKKPIISEIIFRLLNRVVFGKNIAFNFGFLKSSPYSTKIVPAPLSLCRWNEHFQYVPEKERKKN